MIKKNVTAKFPSRTAGQPQLEFDLAAKGILPSFRVRKTCLVVADDPPMA
ncbi:MAG: hypothetical protein NW220_01070 [Leptolyngbyaceae cyanobacterium bins.349]|nr:hypothetical protein [Leptolyngbyaceae cyanobacterium bins.349]